MFFYLILAILISTLTELTFKSESKIYRFIGLIIVVFIPSYFFAVRYGIGTDYFNYVRIFDEIKNGYELRFEWGYELLNRIVALLGGNVVIAFFFTAVIMMSFIYLTLKNYNKLISPGIAIFTFMLMFYQMSFNTVRQGVALAIVLYSVKFIQDRKIVKFVAIIIIASSFHLSSWLFFPMFFLYPLINKRKKFLLRTLLYVSILIVIFSLEQIIPPLFSKVESLNYYLNYLESDGDDSGFGFIVRALPFILIGFYVNQYMKEEKDINWYFSIYIISILLKFTGLVGANFISRISLNFEVILVLLIPLYIKELNKRGQIFVSWLLISYVIVHWWYIFVYVGSHETVPYQWIYGK